MSAEDFNNGLILGMTMGLRVEETDKTYFVIGTVIKSFYSIKLEGPIASFLVKHKGAIVQDRPYNPIQTVKEAISFPKSIQGAVEFPAFAISGKIADQINVHHGGIIWPE